MSAKFYTLLTEIGAAKLASAAALGVPLKITQMAVGDGGGVLPTPSAQQTKLVAEKRRADLNMLYIDPQNSSQMIAEQVIPETEGGWWIREVGLFDDTGALIAVGNCPESYKPQLAEGSGRTQTVRMVLITSSTDNITLKIDPSVVLATRKYVDDKVLELKVYVDDLMAKHLAAADPHSQYAPKDSPTLTGTPKTPTAPAGNNSTQIASTAFVQAALVALINGAPATLDTLKELAAAINNDPAFSTTINNALALKAPLASPALTGTPTAPTAAQTANNTQIATTAFVQAVATTINNALALKAPLANPALTGTPTAPTAAQTVNNTQIATTAFVKSAIAALVASSPAALDTLNELAEALGNDPNFATTMTNALAGKQPLNSTLTDLSGKSVAGILDYLGLGEGSALPVGVPIPWPQATPPDGWIKCNGAAFDKAKYPKLASAYPAGTLPDLRGYFIRGWDDSRGVDSGRAINTGQGPRVGYLGFSLSTFAGAFNPGSIILSDAVNITCQNTNGAAGSINNDNGAASGDAYVIPADTRPWNVAFNYIVRAA
ncbi:phage tail protein [Leclercia sp. CFBP8987]|uniref:phage tail-collar fiber domain-containing protein n=1 Tax=Leclercia sp. CFBP8987 TaxID=3096525 RepID=UPI002A69C28D|nr:phage tail protein [Leclercia sp. CFBP8987]MDY0922641.1 phage tail protein [Leclercia sp. CFBP8987]